MGKFESCDGVGNDGEALKQACFEDMERFALEFFPHWFRLPFSTMHRELFADRQAHVGDRLPERIGRRTAVASPRGYAKSTLKALLFVLHDLAYALEPYILIFSATLPQAELRLKNIRREIERNSRLRALFGEALELRLSNRRSLQVGEALIDAHSAGSEVRGVTHGPYRPTRILLDDVEDSERVESAEQRIKLADWYREVVENLGDTYTNIDLIGTVMHPESLLAGLLKRPDYETHLWSAVIQFSDETALWDEWRERYSDLSNPHRVANARRFFNANNPRMLSGTRVLWPEKEDYYELIAQLTVRGRRAFYQEKQNEPLRPNTAIFDLATFRWFRRDREQLVIEHTEQRIALGDLEIYGFLDSALGKNRHNGDYSAIATIGVDAAGHIYVLDIWLDRATPSEQAARVLEQHDLWNYAMFGIESTGFQSLMAQTIESLQRQRKANGGRKRLPVVEVVPKQSKVERVAALEPIVHAGWILFERALREKFLAQMQQFPNGQHDDGPDALAAAVKLVRRGRSAPSQSVGARKRSSRGF